MCWWKKNKNVPTWTHKKNPPNESYCTLFCTETQGVIWQNQTSSVSRLNAITITCVRSLRNCVNSVIQQNAVAPAAFRDLVQSSDSVTSVVVRNKQTIRSKYTQKRNCEAAVPISTFMCLWAIYIHISPQLICLFCWRKYVDRSWEYINRSQTHECVNWDWGRAIPRKELHKWDFRCSEHGYFEANRTAYSIQQLASAFCHNTELMQFSKVT